MAKETTLLVATIRNEGPNILEWVAHHRLCGFDRIQIHHGDSTDTTAETLQALDRIGAIELHDSRNGWGGHKVQAYKYAARTEAFAQSDWCIALDGDEFFNVTTGSGAVGDLIAACPQDADAILVNWRLFGSSDHREPAGNLVTERFTCAEPEAAIRAEAPSPFRALFRTAAYQCPGVHMPRGQVRRDARVCNASGLTEDAFRRGPWRAFDPWGRKYAQINHYGLRDLGSFLLKAARNCPEREIDLDYWQAHDRNEEKETSLAKRAFATWAEMKRLDQETGGELLRLRQQGLVQWHTALRELLEDTETRALHDAIIAAAEAVPMRQTFKLPGTAEPVFSSRRRRKSRQNVLLLTQAAG